MYLPTYTPASKQFYDGRKKTQDARGQGTPYNKRYKTIAVQQMRYYNIVYNIT